MTAISERLQPSMIEITLARTVQSIAKRSAGVAWDVSSEGLALALTRNGYVLTAMPRFYRDVMPERVIIGGEGTPVAHGHILTPKERKRAILAILLGEPSRSIAEGGSIADGTARQSVGSVR